MKARTSQVLIEHLRRDGGTQIRAALDEATVGEYVDALRAGATLPPVTVLFDGEHHWLPDGFHRVEAHLRAGQKRIAADIVKGTQRDAILLACGANSAHGLPRSNADKRRAVETILADPEWSKWSDRRVATAANVSHSYVAQVRESIQSARVEGGNVATAQRVKEREPAAKVGGLGPSVNAGGDEGAGAVSARESGPDKSPPAPDEPRQSSIDTLGLLDISAEWLALCEDVVTAVDAYDQALRVAQGALAPLLMREDVAAAAQALRHDAHELAARARKSMRPKSVCLYCKDPDGTAGRREECNGCNGLGWLTEDQLVAVPRELEARGEKAKVIDQRKGGYVARKLHIELEDGSEFEPGDTW